MMKERRFSGAKLRIARSFRGLTQLELARQVGCDQSLIGHAEREQKEPSVAILDALCAALGFEPGFFAQPPVDEFLDEECNFRKRKRTTVSTRARALAHGTLFSQLVRYLDACLDLPVDNVPEVCVAEEDDPGVAERAAELCRMTWGLGLDRPVGNVCRAIESNGAVVTKIATGDINVDAFSRVGSRHVVVLTSDKGSASRCRFDAAHELGHLVMHRGRPTGTIASERQADRFASALLLPKAGFMREFPRSQRIDWDRVFDIKSHWGASAAAIVRRAHDLSLIDAAQYQQAYKYMAWKRWSKIGEPYEPEMEEPETVRFACDAMLSEFGESALDISLKLGWREEVLQQVVCFDLPKGKPDPNKGVLVFLDAKRVKMSMGDTDSDAENG